MKRLPDIVTVEEAQALFAATRCLSYRVFYFTVYSMGLRLCLSEGLALKVGDIDAERSCVHVRDSKGNRDRLFREKAQKNLSNLKNQSEHNSTLEPCCQNHKTS